MLRRARTPQYVGLWVCPHEYAERGRVEFHGPRSTAPRAISTSSMPVGVAALSSLTSLLWFARELESLGSHGTREPRVLEGVLDGPFVHVELHDGCLFHAVVVYGSAVPSLPCSRSLMCRFFSLPRLF